MFSGYKEKRGVQRHPLNELSVAIDGQALITRFINEWKENVIAAIRVKGIEASGYASAEELLNILARHKLDISGELLGETNEGEEVKVLTAPSGSVIHDAHQMDRGDSDDRDGLLGGEEVDNVPEAMHSTWSPSPYNPSTGYYYIDGKYIHKDDWASLPAGTREIVIQEYSVSLQLKLAWELLQYIGVDCYLYAGIEADDIIYSLVAQYPCSPVLIRADDGDLRDCYLYNNRVTIKSVSNRGKLDLFGNYSELYRKTFEGCISDNVPSLLKTDCLQYRQELAECMHKGMFNPYSIKFGNGEFGRFTDEPLKELGIPERPAKLLAINFYIVYPFLVTIPDKYTEIDLGKLVDVLSVLHMKKTLTWLGRERCVSWYMQRYMDNVLTRIPEYFKKWLGSELFVPVGESIAEQMFDGEAEALASTLNNI